MKYLWKTKKEEISEEYIAEKRKEFAVEMSIWEHYCSGEFIAGDQFTMADVYFFPYLAISGCKRRFDVRWKTEPKEIL